MSMKDRVAIFVSLLVGIIVGMMIMVGVALKPASKPTAEAPAPRFEIVHRQMVDGYTLLVLRDGTTGQDYLAYRYGMVLLGKGTNQ
jgi:hypothetical protein